jgi:pimeloyl-ACP methyl ester carboxylesterase
MTYELKQVLVNGQPLAVDCHGEGEPMLLVHGLGGTANSFSPLVGAFAATHRVCVPDLPGAGRSPRVGEISIARLVADVLAVMDALRLQAVHLVGHSMGTVVCQHLAAVAPGRVRDLVLLGPLSEPPEAARPALRSRAEAAAASGMGPIAEVICERGLAAVTRQRKPVITGFVRELLQRQAPADYAAHCLALAAAVKADPSRITCRTLLVAGFEDTTSPPASVAALAASLAGATHVELPDCGHWTALEQPEAVVAAMRVFYAG